MKGRPNKTARRQSGGQYYSTLNNRVFEATSTLEQYQQAVASFIAFESDSLFEPLVKKLLLERKRFQSAFNCYARRIEDFCALSLYRQHVTVGRILCLYKVILEHNAHDLTAFADARDRFEVAYLHAKYELADSLLEQCRERHGESLWYVRSKILLLSNMGDADRTKMFFEESKRRSSDLLVSTLVGFFQLISDSDDAWLHLKNSILGSIKEFEAAGYDQPAAFLALMFCPRPLVAGNDCTKVLSMLQALPVIDIYVLLLRLGQGIATEAVCGNAPDETAAALINVLSTLARKVNDPLLSRACSFLNTGLQTTGSPEGTAILGSYEVGDYEKVVATYWDVLDSLGNPLAYINIVAKAYAYQGAVPLPGGRNLVSQLLTHFTALYSVTTPPEPTEEAIISQIVRHHGLALSAHIQLSLYVALPQKYSSYDAKKASAASHVVNTETTPLMSALLDGPAVAFGARYEYRSPDEPVDYRKVKRQICHLVDLGADESAVEDEFKKFEALTPLKKDYFELYSEYCLHKARFTPLIGVCARSLAENTDYYQRVGGDSCKKPRKQA